MPDPDSTADIVILKLLLLTTAVISNGLVVKSDAEYPVSAKLATAEIVTKFPTDAPCDAQTHVTRALPFDDVKVPVVEIAAALPLVPFDWGVSSFIVPFVASKI